MRYTGTTNLSSYTGTEKVIYRGNKTPTKETLIPHVRAKDVRKKKVTEKPTKPKAVRKRTGVRSRLKKLVGLK